MAGESIAAVFEVANLGGVGSDLNIPCRKNRVPEWIWLYQRHG